MRCDHFALRHVHPLLIRLGTVQFKLATLRVLRRRRLKREQCAEIRGLFDYFDPLTLEKNRYRMISSDTAVRLAAAVVSLVAEGR